VKPVIPRSMLVLGQRFKVVQTRNLRVNGSDVKGEHPNEVVDVLGLTDSDIQTIYLETDQGDDKLAETFLHESLHALWAATGLRVTHGEEEEQIVKRLSPIMLDWLRRNPAVYTALTGRHSYR